MAKSCTAAGTSTGNTLGWILLTVSGAINNPGRVCFRCFPNCRPEHSYSIITHAASSRPIGVVNTVNLRPLVRYSLYICRTRTCYISTVITYISVINNGSIMDNVYYTCIWRIIIIDVGPIDISLRCANPIPVGYIVSAAKRKAYANAGHQRSPTIIAAALAPAHPCWCPFIAGDPFPAVIIIIMPAAIMESCPSPGVI